MVVRQIPAHRVVTPPLAPTQSLSLRCGPCVERLFQSADGLFRCYMLASQCALAWGENIWGSNWQRATEVAESVLFTARRPRGFCLAGRLSELQLCRGVRRLQHFHTPFMRKRQHHWKKVNECQRQKYKHFVIVLKWIL